MERQRSLLGAATAAGLALSLSATSNAQPADLPIPPATTDQYPPGVTVRQTTAGPVYADAAGRTLYGMDMRTLVRWNPDPAQFCQNACADSWTPLLAPAGSKPNIVFPRGSGERPRGNMNAVPTGFIPPQSAPDWTIIAGPQGPQWVYKGWHIVYARKGDQPGSTAHEGADQRTWNTLKYVPPVPKLAAPSNVAPLFADGAYALADKTGRVLFTGTCAKDCAGWTPLAAPMASRGFGDWTVSLAGDTPQWVWRGKPVYVGQEDNPLQAPKNGTVLRP